MTDQNNNKKILQLREDYKITFGSDQGKIVLNDLEIRCHEFVTTFSKNIVSVTGTANDSIPYSRNARINGAARSSCLVIKTLFFMSLFILTPYKVSRPDPTDYRFQHWPISGNHYYRPRTHKHAKRHRYYRHKRPMEDYIRRRILPLRPAQSSPQKKRYHHGLFF